MSKIWYDAKGNESFDIEERYGYFMKSKKTKGILSSVAGAVVLLIVYVLQGGTPAEDGNDTQNESQETVAEAEDSLDDSEQAQEVQNTEDAGVQEAQNGEDATTQEEGDPEMEVYYEEEVVYTFRNEQLLEEHYEKHGIEMGFSSMEEYEAAALAVILNDEALYKTEEEDGDGVYYLEETNEFVVLSQDGYIRTYFYPSAGIDYFERQ